MRPGPPRTREVEVLEDPRSFEALKEEWGELHRNSPLATPFQSWAWLYSWWEAYGEGYGLRLVTVRDESGLLMGLAPMMVERRFARLLFVGSGRSEYLDVISRDGREEEVVEAATNAIREIVGFRGIADFEQIPPGAVAWGVLRRWRGPLRASVRHDSCPVMEAGASWDEVLAPLSSNLRSTFRRAVRRAEKDGVVVEEAGPGEAAEAAGRFVKLHREMWSSRDISPEHLTERFADFMEAAARRMTADGLGGIREFRRDGEVVASHFVVFGRDSVGYLLSGAREDALRRYQISSLFVWDGVNAARERGKPLFDFLRGEDAYKLRWNPTVVPNHRIIVGRNPFTWTPYAGGHALLSTIRMYANSRNAPRWLGRAKDIYRSLRFRLARR